MKLIHATLRLSLAASFILTPVLRAGELPPTQTEKAAQPQDGGVEIIATLPVWAAGLSGEVGIAGFDPVAIDVPFKDIFRNLDMTASMTLEIRQRRWGLILDGMYLKMSGSTETPGSLLNSIDVQVKQVLAEAALTYRVWEGERGYLDVLAGARYLYLRNELSFDLDSAGVRELSHQLSDVVVDRAVNAIGEQVRKTAARAEAKLNALNLEERADALRTELRTTAIEKVLEERLLLDIIQAIRDLSPAERAYIKRKIENSKTVLAANKALAQAVVQERIASAVNAARKKAQRAVARAKAQLADAIESAVRNTIPEHVAASKGWVDPFVGFRSRYHLTERLYLSARGDIGGFGVASDLTWNVFGALGYQWTEKVSTELGYRHLAIDYKDGGFVFDTETSGLFLGLTMKL